MAKKSKRRFVRVELTPVERAMAILAINMRNNPPMPKEVPWEKIYWSGRAFEILRKHDFERKTMKDLREEGGEAETFKLPVGVYNVVRKAFEEVTWWQVDMPEDLAHSMLKFGLEPREDMDVEGDVEVEFEDEDEEEVPEEKEAE